MKRYVSGLSQASGSSSSRALEGVFLVRIVRVHSRWYSRKPYLLIELTVAEPKPHAGAVIIARLECTPKALWKLNWFLRDFGYDPDLIERNEIDDRRLIGLSGVVHVTHTIVSGVPVLNLESFAPADQWPKLSGAAKPQPKRTKAAS